MNAGLFHHDSVQLAEAIETHNWNGAVGGRAGVVLLYSIPYYFYPNAYLTSTLMTILLASLSCLILYLFIKDFSRNEFIAFCTAMLFSFSPLYLSISTYTKEHAAAIFFILLTLWIFYKRHYLVAGILFVISLFMRIDNILMLPVFITLYILYHHEKKWHNLLYFFIPILTLCSISFYFNLLFKNSSDFIVWTWKLIPLFVISSDRLIGSIHLYVFIMAILSLLLLFWKRRDTLLIFTGIWFFSIFVPMALMNVASARLFIIALIPLCILAAYFIHWTIDQTENENFAGHLVIAALILAQIAFIIPTLEYRHHTMGGKELADAFKSVVPEDGYVILEDENVFIEYYAGLKTIGPKGDFIGKSLYTTSDILKSYDLPFAKEPLKIVEYDDFHHSELGIDLRNITIYRLS